MPRSLRRVRPVATHPPDVPHSQRRSEPPRPLPVPAAGCQIGVPEWRRHAEREGTGALHQGAAARARSPTVHAGAAEPNADRDEGAAGGGCTLPEREHVGARAFSGEAAVRGQRARTGARAGTAAGLGRLLRLHSGVPASPGRASAVRERPAALIRRDTRGGRRASRRSVHVSRARPWRSDDSHARWLSRGEDARGNVTRRRPRKGITVGFLRRPR
mmetsp:Transcript_28230/g.71651  ORF Transcript_28230/g.71651 Transcript_28230/m.71651 type:complete len:216 (+) Transcript_28230:1781-2428(+)